MSIKKRVNKIESDILSSNLSNYEKQKKIRSFLLDSFEYPNYIKYILYKYKIVIEYGADEILNLAYNRNKYELVKILIYHIDDINCIYNSIIIEDTIFKYSLMQEKIHYEIFKMLIKKYNIIQYAYKCTLNKNLIKDVIDLIILCINNGCDINFINDVNIKKIVIQHFRKNKLIKIYSK